MLINGLFALEGVTVLPPKMSASQIRSKLRQLQSKQKQAIDRANREIRAHNQKVKAAVNKHNQEVRKYNTEVRRHNARVRQNRSRLKREIARLSSTNNNKNFEAYRTTVQTVHQSYERLEARAETGAYPEQYNELLDLSEREAANNASLMNALLGEPENTEVEPERFDSEIEPILKLLAEDAQDRWKGALFSLAPENPDAARHFCTSARELLTNILDTYAPNDRVLAAIPDCDKIPSGSPSRRAKIAYFLHARGMDDDNLEEFVDEDLDSVIKLFRTFNDGTHGSSGKFSHAQLLAIKKRVEDSVQFLWNIIPENLRDA